MGKISLLISLFPSCTVVIYWSKDKNSFSISPDSIWNLNTDTGLV